MYVHESTLKTIYNFNTAVEKAMCYMKQQIGVNSLKLLGLVAQV